VRRTIAETAFGLTKGGTIRATAPVGLASAAAAIDLEESISKADKALYAAKARVRGGGIGSRRVDRTDLAARVRAGK
jgi:GGDEF domain-containing protein